MTLKSLKYTERTKTDLPKKIPQTGFAFLFFFSKVYTFDMSQPGFVQVMTYCNLDQFAVTNFKCQLFTTEKRRLGLSVFLVRPGFHLKILKLQWKNDGYGLSFF